MTKTWIQKRKRDQYSRLARLRGYRSRAAYKLLQAVRTYHLIKPGDKVVDLGSQPGGWLQVAREIVGPNGFVLGVDIKQTAPLGYSNVHILNLDIYSENIVPKIVGELGGPANVLLSDLAPSIIGSWEVDHARQVGLARQALHIASNILVKDGNTLIKLFHGPELKKLEEEARPLFVKSRLLKPPASRPESSEIYFLGLEFQKEWTKPLYTEDQTTSSSIIFLTGQPGTGKTTLVRKVVDHFKDQRTKIMGIISEEVREGKSRIGFKIANLATNKEGWLARKTHNDAQSGIHIGPYTVQQEDLEEIGVEALASAVLSNPDIVVIDEIGPMEMTSPRFRDYLRKILAGRVPVLATVRYGSHYTEVEELHNNAIWFEITKENRETVGMKLIGYVDSILQKKRLSAE